jgi:hemerythrin-like domain-containing protein
MNQTTADLPRAHQTMLLAHRAMVRDLDRVSRTAEQLAAADDPARAAALKDYAAKLSEVIEHHHKGEDDFLWPRLREHGVDEGALALMSTEHAELGRLLHSWNASLEKLGTAAAAREVAERTEEVRTHVAEHAADEEKELLGRLAPGLDDRVWKGFEVHMRKSAPGWTLRFMPAWLASVAGPDERGGVPAAPVARLFRGWLEKRQRAAFGENY